MFPDHAPQKGCEQISRSDLRRPLLDLGERPERLAPNPPRASHQSADLCQVQLPAAAVGQQPDRGRDLGGLQPAGPDHEHDHNRGRSRDLFHHLHLRPYLRPVCHQRPHGRGQKEGRSRRPAAKVKQPRTQGSKVEAHAAKVPADAEEPRPPADSCHRTDRAARSSSSCRSPAASSCHAQRSCGHQHHARLQPEHVGVPERDPGEHRAPGRQDQPAGGRHPEPDGEDAADGASADGPAGQPGQGQRKEMTIALSSS